MKRSQTGSISRRSFLIGTAATVVGIAHGSPTCNRTYANDALEVSLDGDAAQGELKHSDANQLIQKKVCMLGASAVGKTSLVKRFVDGIYDDKYLDSLGVKIDKKVVDIGERRMVILLWDIKADDDFQKFRASYLRGASGILLVVDGTRRRTLEVAMDFHRRINEGVAPIPSVVLMFNKSDLSSQWEVRNSDIENIAAKNIPVVTGSAKTGKGVEECFLTLAAEMVKK